MSRDSNRRQEYWDEESDDDADEPRLRRPARRRQQDEEEEYDQPQRRRSGVSCLLIGCVGGVLLLVLLAVVGVFVAGGNVPLPTSGVVGVGSSSSAYMQPNQQTLQLSTISQMQIDNQVGNISIIVDPGATAPTVTTVKRVKAASNDDAQKEFGRISVQVQADTATNTLTVSVILPNASSCISNKNSDAVDVTIMLPPSVVPKASTPLILNADTSVGNVLLNGLDGVLMVKDCLGNVTAHQAMLAAGSHLETGTGDVVFDGGIDTTTGSANSQPMYKLQAEQGDVDVTLPAATNVILDANVNVGKITSDFAINVTSTAGSPSYYGPLMSGPTPPNAVLVLDVSSGNIDVRK